MTFKFPWFRRQKDVSVEEDALRWVIREDGGLSGDEVEKLDKLKSANIQFSEVFEKSGKAWKLLDDISPALAFESSPYRKSGPSLSRPVYLGLAVAAVVLWAAVWHLGLSRSVENDLYFTETRSTIEPWTQRLPDGSMVRLNANTKLEVSFTPGSRRVKLLQGEAHFTVAKDPERPFRVFANQVQVRAVGTAFNVRLEANKVDVLVTEGTVEIAPEEFDLGLGKLKAGNRPGEKSPLVRLVSSGHRAEVHFQHLPEDRALAVLQADSEVIKQNLAWQNSLLTLGGDSLDVIASTFEQKTGIKLIIADPELNHLRIGGQFPSENVKGFLQVLKSGYGIQWSEKSDGTLVVGDSYYCRG